MDRSCQFIEMFYSQVVSHPVIAQSEKLKKQAELITEAMVELNQMTAEPA